MVLNLGEKSKNLFQHSKEFEQGQGKIRKGAGTFIVALDGSGDFDDIQEAINALPKSGGVVYIKEGTYNVTNPITITSNNVSLFGAGKSTIIKGSTALAQIIYVNGGDYISIRDLSFGRITTVGIRPLIAIELENSIGSFIEGCWIDDNIHGAGIVLSGTCEGITIRNCNIDGEGTHPNQGILIEASDSIVESCYINDVQMGIGSVNAAGYNRNKIIGCIIKSCSASGINLNTFNDSQIIGSLIDGCSQDAINLVSSDRNVISGNSIINTTQGLGTGYGIDIDANSDRNIICGNIIYNNQDGAVRDNGTNTHPNGASGTTNLTVDDLNIIA